uniref:Zn(2)-C6 fungal-type domain-containing protein n=2 Tax=Kalmanozyma brasiliensis (strain GHG001) TaxID=1365824 RepID=V5EVZ6_KALBG
MCQQRKARCELPDLEVPSSSLPLPYHQACHRCKTLQISCIVDDANKKKPKVSTAESGSARSTPSKRRSSAAATDRPAMRKSSTTTSLASNFGDTLGAQSQASTSSTSLVPSSITPSDANDLKLAGGREVGDHIVYPAEARLVSKTPDPSSDEDEAPPSTSASRPSDRFNKRAASSGSDPHIKTQDRSPRDAANIDTWERFSTRSRPLTLLTELVPRQNGFASKVFRLVSARATIETDVTEIVSNEKSKQLSDWCENNLTLWMPHISNAYQIRQEALQGKQTLSTQLLEQVLYLIALQHIRDPADDVTRFSVTRFVIRDLARLNLTSPRSPKAVEALELLALFPVDVSAIPGPSRNRIRTDSQINAAERFARSVRLDRVALTAAAPYSFFTSTNQLDDFETKRTAMAWASVKAWYNCFTLGDDELYESIDGRFFSDDWSRSLILPDEPPLRQARDEVPENELFQNRRWSCQRRIGSVGLATRCLAMRQLLRAFDAIANAPIEIAEAHRLAHLSSILDDYKRQTVSVDQEFVRSLDSISDGGELLRTWLNIEMTAGYLLVLGAAILRGLGIDKKENVPSHELALLVRGENASPEMREFLTRFGEHRILAAEKVLVNVSVLCRDARAAKTASTNGRGRSTPTTQDRWMVEGQSRTVLPMMNVCGFALEAAFNAMEMHATMFKLWKTPPKRSESWQLVFSNVVTAMLSLDPKGSIQSGSIPATCAYILQGMLKVIACWTDCSRKKEHQRTTSTGNGAVETGVRRGPRLNGAGSRPQERRAAVEPEVDRYAAMLQDEMTQKSIDAVHAFEAPSVAGYRNGVAPRPDHGEAVSSPYRSSAATFAPESSFMRGSHPGQRYGPDATESLAAALPPSGGLEAGNPAIYHHQQRYHPYSSSIPASGSSNASSHTHTPPPYYANGVPMGNARSNGSSFGMVDPTNGQSGDAGSAAFDSLDFILNDVLGSSEWSGILQDIWRTDM